jgi:hypothetical protein
MSTTEKLSKGNRGLKVANNYKAGAAASNPSLLNGTQKVLGGFKLRTHSSIGIAPCTLILASI